MFHAFTVKFDVTRNLKKFWKLKALAYIFAIPKRLYFQLQW